MSKGPNKIILLPDDIMFVMPKGSIFTSKVRSTECEFIHIHLLSFTFQVNLKNEPHERSNASIRSEEIQAGKTARYNVSSIRNVGRSTSLYLGRSGRSEETPHWSLVAPHESDA